MTGNIKLVVFDADGVLQNNREKKEYFEKEVDMLFSRNGVIIDKTAASKAWKAPGVAASRGEITPTEARKIYFKELGIPTGLVAAYEKIDMDSLALVKPSEEHLRDKLMTLKVKGYKLAILSNTIYDSNAKGKVMDQIGLSGVFDRIFVANEIKHRKPEKEAYLAVLSYFSMPPGATVFVGEGEEEMEGAKALGMRTISYRGYDKAEFLATDFDQIINWILKL